MDHTAQLAAEREALLDMFQHPGWAALVRQTKERLEMFREGMPFNIATQEQLYFAKGMVSTLTELVNLQERLSVSDERPPDEQEPGEDE